MLEAKWYCPGCRNAGITSGDPNEDADEDDEEGDEGDDEGEEEADTGEESHPSCKRKRVQSGAKTVPGGSAKYLPPAKPTSVADDEAVYQESEEENSDDDYSNYSESGRNRKRSRMQLKRRRKPVRGKTNRLTTAAKTLPPSNRRTGASGAVLLPSSSDVKRAMGGKSGPGGVPVPASFIKSTTGAKAGPRGELILGKHEGSPRQEDEVEVDRYNVDEDSRDGRRRRRAQIAALEAFDKSKGKWKRAEPTSTDEDEDEMDSGSQARRKRPRTSVAAKPPHPLPSGTRSRPSTSCARKAPPPANDGAWTDSVSDKVATLVQERIDAGDHTEKKWQWIAAQLKLRHGIDKTHSAIKNYWGRNLRGRYNIDERRVAKPDKLVTGMQSKEDRKRARELAKLKKGQLATDPISVDDDDVVKDKEKTSADAEDVPADVQDSSSEEEEPLAANYHQRKALDKVSSATDNVVIVKRKRRNDEVDPDDEDDDEDAFRRVPKRHQRHNHA